jgi:hypothetical protein
MNEHMIFGRRVSIAHSPTDPENELLLGTVLALAFDRDAQSHLALVQLDDGSLVDVGIPGIGEEDAIGLVKVIGGDNADAVVALGNAMNSLLESADELATTTLRDPIGIVERRNSAARILSERVLAAVEVMAQHWRPPVSHD